MSGPSERTPHQGSAYRHMGQSFTGGGSGAGVSCRQLHHQGAHPRINNSS